MSSWHHGVGWGQSRCYKEKKREANPESGLEVHRVNSICSQIVSGMKHRELEKKKKRKRKINGAPKF